MKTRRTLLLFAVLLISGASFAQSSQQKSGSRPVSVVTDTNFLKKALHLQRWADTTLKFIMYHDTMFILLSQAQMPLQEKFRSSFFFEGSPKDTIETFSGLRPAGIDTTTLGRMRNRRYLRG